MEQPEITLSIVTYHTDPAILSACLKSVAQITIPFWCYCIDNSQNSKVENQVLRAACGVPACSRIEYIPNLNTGYGRAHNIAIERAMAQTGSRFHLAMNPDISFGKGAVETLTEWMQGQPDIGLAGPKIVYPDGRLQRLCKLLPTPGHLFTRRFFPLLAKKRDSLYQLESADYDTSFDCPSLSGCFMFFRMEALRRVGLFDERFFMYFEDVDLARRIGQKYRICYYPQAAVIHHYQKGSYSSWKLLRLHVVSAVKYFNKWGWFFDMHRKKVNRETLNHLQKKR